jgi:hypothetical protein
MAKIVRITFMYALVLTIGIFGGRLLSANAGAVAQPKMPSLPRASESPVHFGTDRKFIEPSTDATANQTVKPAALNSMSWLQDYVTPSFPQSGTGSDGTADLNPIGRSDVRALISVQKIGRTASITGFATGLDPYKAYVSLFYDAGSAGSGPCACIPSNPPPPPLAATCKTTDAHAVNFSQMLIGYWLPLIGSSTKTLQVLKAGTPDAPGGTAFVELEKIGSVAIREDRQLGTPMPSAPDAARFPLRACGKFTINK